MITIDTNSANQRFDRRCRKYFKPYSHITLKDIYNRIRKGWIKIVLHDSVDHKPRSRKENYIIQAGDQIWFHQLVDDQLVNKESIKTNNGHIETLINKLGTTWKDLIIYQDDERLIWNKPVGIVAHEWNGHEHDVTMNQLLAYAVNNSLSNKSHEWSNDTLTSVSHPHSTFKPAFAYRLDKDTSGVLVSALTYPALQHINALIRDHTITKIYQARVVGAVDTNQIARKYKFVTTDGWDRSSKKWWPYMMINMPLFKGFHKTSGRAHVFVNHEKWLESTTWMRVVKIIEDPLLGPVSLIECQLHTGRMHQIRVHMSHIGHPIIGDIQYGQGAINRIAHKQYQITRQLLHSHQYTFLDHRNFTIKAIAPLPEDFKMFE